MKADASLAPLNNAQIEVRAMSGARAPSRFPHPRAVRAACQSGGSPAGFDGFRGRFGIFFERDVGRVHPKTRGGSRSVEKHRLVSIRVFSGLRGFCMFLLRALSALSADPNAPSSPRLPRSPRLFYVDEPPNRQLYWPDDGMWYKAEVVSLNQRARTAKVLYATGDVETLSVDEIAAEGHLNVCA